MEEGPVVAEVRYFAFYDELGFRVGQATRFRDLECRRSPDKESVVAYLRAGAPLVVVPGDLRDPAQGCASGVWGGGSILTDGGWAWPRIAAELVDRHDLAVPAAFLARMRGSFHASPALPR
ncbi:hypothetical protein [Micromonospora sp. NPDC050495]|uniref:hypothetical protein n=1 Tax=Micromonospora sp. NPDC050495 TaxID=3154936 RepID=UPI00340E037E